PASLPPAPARGARLRPAEAGRAGGPAGAPPRSGRAAEGAATPFALVVPVRVGGTVAATLELLRSHGDFGPGDRRIVRLAAAELSLALRAFGGPARPGAAQALAEQLEVAGDALVAGGDETRTADHVVRLVVE